MVDGMFIGSMILAILRGYNFMDILNMLIPILLLFPAFVARTRGDSFGKHRYNIRRIAYKNLSENSFCIHLKQRVPRLFDSISSDNIEH